MLTWNDAMDRLVAQYRQMAEAGTMESRHALAPSSGLTWNSYLEAHQRMIYDEAKLAAEGLAIRYDQRTRLWTAGGAGYAASGSYDEFPLYVKWHRDYLRTRAMTVGHHLGALKAAFPAKARPINALARHVRNVVEELEDMNL